MLRLIAFYFIGCDLKGQESLPKWQLHWIGRRDPVSDIQDDNAFIEALVQNFADTDIMKHLDAWDALEWLGPAVVPYLLKNLHKYEPKVQQGVITALGLIGDSRALDLLLELLVHNDTQIRWCAVKALGRLNDARALSSLVAALTDKCRIMRLMAIDALADLRNRRAVEPLIQRLTEEDDEDLRFRIIVTLSESGDPRILTPLARMWEIEENENMRKLIEEVFDRFILI